MTAREESPGWLHLAIALLSLGLLLQLWLWSRAWMYWDQVILLRLGVDLAHNGELAAIGKTISGGVVIPGSLLQILVGAPLVLWFDYRSPGLLMGLCQVAAILVLWIALRPRLGIRFCALVIAVYWLSPWRLFHSGFLWEPSFLFLPAAVHLWACLALRQEARWLPSFLLGAVALLAPQLHPSGVVLGVAALLLWLTRSIQVHLPSFGLGLATASLSLLPTLRAAYAGSVPSPFEQGIGELGLIKVYPLVRVLGYWPRMGSLDIGRRIRQITLSEELGPQLAGGLLATLAVIGSLSILLAVVANVHGARLLAKRRDSARGFLLVYAGLFLVAELAAVAISPITPQGWHLLVGLHAACLPIVVWIEHLLDSSPIGGRRFWLMAAAFFLLLRLPVVLALGWGHPMYRVPSDPSEKRQLAPDRLPTVEPRPPPFG